jgi:hypothetical protein
MRAEPRQLASHKFDALRSGRIVDSRGCAKANGCTEIDDHLDCHLLFLLESRSLLEYTNWQAYLPLPSLRGRTSMTQTMQHSWWRWIAVVLLPVVAFVSAESTRAKDDFKPEEGYTSLFNGKDLTGWHYVGSKENLEGKTETADQRIQVMDGAIVMNPKDANGKGGIRDLYTIKEYNKPFRLKLQFRAGLKADSGVYIRGTQLQVRDYPRFGGQYSKIPGFKLDDWNDLDITVSGKTTRTTVNGKTLTDQDVFELAVKDGKPSARLNGKDVAVAIYQHAEVAYALCKNNGEILEKAFQVPLKGGTGKEGIGLQAETGKFEFRHIRIKELP